MHLAWRSDDNGGRGVMPVLRALRWEALLGLGVASALAVLVAIGANGWTAARERHSSEAWELHTIDVLRGAAELEAAVTGAAASERAYLLSRDPGHARMFDRHREEAVRAEGRLLALTADNAGQQRKLARLRRLVGDYFASLRAEMGAARAAGSGTADRASVTDERLDAVLATLSASRGLERRLLAERNAVNSAAASRTEGLGYLVLALGFTLLLIAAFEARAILRAVRAKDEALAELRRVSMTDELTQLANRRHFFARLAEELARAARQSTPLAVAILDVDHFKQINDGWGHAAGDAVLRETAARLEQATRAGELVGRIGGEEFAVLLPGAAPDQAWRVCDRLREAQSAPIALPGGDTVRSTLSGGVAVLIDGESAERLMARADRALYTAKHDGRDQVKLAA